MRYLGWAAVVGLLGCADDTTAGDGGSTSSATATTMSSADPTGSTAVTAAPTTDATTSTTGPTGTAEGGSTGTTGVEFTSTSTSTSTSITSDGPPDTTTTGSTSAPTGTTGTSSSTSGPLLDVGVLFDVGMKIDVDDGGILLDVGLPGTTTGFGTTGGGDACLIEFPFDALDCPDGWTVEATDVSASSPSWECGDPPGDSDEPPDGASGMWATDLDGDYDNDESSALTSPAIDLSACDGEIELWLVHYYAFEGGLGDADGGIVQVETSPGVWESVTPTLGYANGPLSATFPPVDGEDGFSGNDGIGFAWALSVFDLTGYADQSIRLRFVFGSDDMTTASGWYLDEAVIASSG